MTNRSSTEAKAPVKKRTKKTTREDPLQQQPQQQVVEPLVEPATRSVSALVPAGREPTIPLMLRPKVSQKACVEKIAEQMGVRRSQFDPTFYLTGALLMGVERVSKGEGMIGTLTRKQVAALLKSAFTPLFELLYEEDELPLVFSLLISRGSPAPAPMPQWPGATLSQTTSESISAAPPSALRSETYVPALSAGAEVGLDGFPGEI